MMPLQVGNWDNVWFAHCALRMRSDVVILHEFHAPKKYMVTDLHECCQQIFDQKCHAPCTCLYDEHEHE